MKITPILGALSALILASVAVAGCESESGDNAGGFTLPNFDGGVFLPDGTPAGSIETTLTSHPNALTNKAEARFEFTSSRPSKFGCRVDGQSPAECTSPFTVTVKEGKHTFEVAAATTDAVDTTPEKFEWTFDLTPPKTVITKAPPAFDNSTTVTVEFSASEQATFLCTLDTSTPVSCTSPFKLSNLTDGKHTISIAATDAAGNVENPPAAATWTVDTTLPDTTIDSGPTGIVNTTSSDFTFSSPSADATITFECSVDAAAFTACTSPQTVTSATDGPRSFKVRAKDGSGNIDPTPAERTWTVDTVAPTVTITGGPNGPTNATAPSFTFTTAGSPTTTECRADSNAFAACTSPWTTPVLGEGGHTVEVRVKDAANNTSSATRAFTVDTILPTVSITSGPSGPTNLTTPTFGFNAEAGATVTCRIDLGTFVACNATYTTPALTDGNHTFEVQANDGANTATASRAFSVDTQLPIVNITGGPSGPVMAQSGTFTFTVNEPTTNQCRIQFGTFSACTTSFPFGPLPDGTYTFEVEASDGANSATQTRSFTVDTVAPTVNITSGPNGLTNIASPSFGFTTGGGATGTTCRVDANPFLPCTSPYSTGTLGSGAHTINVRAVDAAGNPATATRNITVDTTPPTANITGGPTGVSAGSPVTFTYTAEVGSTRQCRIYTQGTPSGAYSACPTSPYTTFAPNIDGFWTFELRVTDAAGNSVLRFLNFSTYIIG